MTPHFDNPTKQEIWATVRKMNDVWTKGDPSDLVNYFHKDMIAITPADHLRREGAAECVAGWSGFAKAAKIRIDSPPPHAGSTRD